MSLVLPDKLLRWLPVIEDYESKYVNFPVDNSLILAMVWQESAGDPWAIRYESRYQYFYDLKTKKSLYKKGTRFGSNRINALSVLGETEFHMQSTSFGLLQIMGAVAREYGFVDKYLTTMCNAEFNIEVGLRVIKKYYELTGNVEKMLLRYNGGGNKNYPQEVIAKHNAIKALTK